MIPTLKPQVLTRSRGFTLTEIMIALALVALLLVGISRIFAITSTTISTGQALAKAMRGHKAIQTSLSNDFSGVGDLAQPDYQSGMMPLVNTADPNYAAPFLSISNFRVAAYKNRADQDADPTQPADYTTNNAANYAARSLAIRTVQDLNNDGDFADPGETVPIYSYGERNFRADSIAFFGKGKFYSQTGSDNFIDPASSNEAFIWYGHLRVFNSDAAVAGAINGYGSPGDALTIVSDPPPPEPALSNRNNRFADEFRLGRVVNLLVEPTDTRYDNSNATEVQKVAGDTVVADGDITRPIAFIARDWSSPTSTATVSMLPILPSNDFVTPRVTSSYRPGEIVKYYGTSVGGQNRRLGANDRVESQGGTAPWAFAALGRSDIAGSGIKQLRQRAEFQSRNFPLDWWRVLPNDWDDRYFVNPFPAVPLTSGGLSQRQQILADSCSQFIVEFAGDFITQNADGSFNGNMPDGILDFVTTSIGGGEFIRSTRWYGLPRDVDGDGVVSPTGWVNSQDVVPVRDVRGTVSSFERRVPTPAANYLAELTEPSGAMNSNPSGYVCVWGPNEFAAAVTPVAKPGTTARPLPQLIRIIADLRDPNGTLKEPVTQEYIFPVRVTAAIEAPKTP